VCDRYNQYDVTPAFPFGHGLSYTTFSYDNLSIATTSSPSATAFDVRLTLTNTGAAASAEVPQLYLTFPAAANTPVLQLKGFVKTAVLSPGAQTAVSFSLSAADLSVWREGAGWEVVLGEYGVAVGASSADLRLKASFTVSL
jgi:beta-glucosidase